MRAPPPTAAHPDRDPAPSTVEPTPTIAWRTPIIVLRAAADKADPARCRRLPIRSSPLIQVRADSARPARSDVRGSHWEGDTFPVVEQVSQAGRRRNVGREGRPVLKVVQTDLEGQRAAVERTFTEGALAPRRQGWPWPTS